MLKSIGDVSKVVLYLFLLIIDIIIGFTSSYMVKVTSFTGRSYKLLSTNALHFVKWFYISSMIHQKLCKKPSLKLTSTTTKFKSSILKSPIFQIIIKSSSEQVPSLIHVLSYSGQVNVWSSMEGSEDVYLYGIQKRGKLFPTDASGETNGACVGAVNVLVFVPLFGGGKVEQSVECDGTKRESFMMESVLGLERFNDDTISIICILNNMLNDGLNNLVVPTRVLTKIIYIHVPYDSIERSANYLYYVSIKCTKIYFYRTVIVLALRNFMHEFLFEIRSEDRIKVLHLLIKLSLTLMLLFERLVVLWMNAGFLSIFFVV